MERYTKRDDMQTTGKMNKNNISISYTNIYNISDKQTVIARTGVKMERVFFSVT